VSTFCGRALDALCATPCSLSVVLVGERKIRDLNRRFRNRDCATDVLSFSYGEEECDGLPFLGEIVIAPRVAFRQARRFRTSAEMEMRRLLVHGLLHLLGYDHETDGGEMLRMQRRVLRRRALVLSAPVAASRERP
jgi:probable rRNA maturation factor